MRAAGVCCFPSDPDTAADLQTPLWSPRVHPNAFILLPVSHIADASGPTIKLAHLDGLDLRRAADGWHGIWQADGIAHRLWLPRRSPDASAFYGTFLPLDAFYELRSHAARRFWRSVEGRRPGPDFRTMPTQLRQWHVLSLRALDARTRRELSHHRGSAARIQRHERGLGNRPTQEQGPPPRRPRHQDDARRLSHAAALSH